ncbi:MAG TPA: DUF4258 domain-containing protein [Methanosarcinales archaeon]|nr:DUF4258 domain-containing protein [Methanosarcinales archaeon]
MYNDSITEKELLESIMSGITIESYLDDIPFPSILIYGKINKKHIHQTLING